MKRLIQSLNQHSGNVYLECAYRTRPANLVSNGRSNLKARCRVEVPHVQSWVWGGPVHADVNASIAEAGVIVGVDRGRIGTVRGHFEPDRMAIGGRGDRHVFTVTFKA